MTLSGKTFALISMMYELCKTMECPVSVNGDSSFKIFGIKIHRNFSQVDMLQSTKKGSIYRLKVGLANRFFCPSRPHEFYYGLFHSFSL